MPRAFRHLRVATAFALTTLLLTAVGAPADTGDTGAAVDFARDIRPIFAERCISCHGPDKQKADLRLDRKREAVRGSENGPVLVPGKAHESRLFQLISGADPDLVMPPKGEPLNESQVGVMKAWIDAGASWPDDPADADPGRHWAFKPLERPAVPEIETPRFAIRNPIDAFIARALEARQLAPTPEAAPHTLIRRLSLDLTGLPPRPEEVSAFVHDRSPGAYSNLVERLLASRQYGERWGRHWLDLARWAETEGYEANTLRSSVWRYRDYVVRSFNDDKPHDQFLLEQIAGDELEPYSDEHLIATGFLSSARYSNNEEDKAKQRNDILVDIANATAAVTLGLTMNCAQCHDHKFDPISIHDYYRWQGFFARGQLVYALLEDGQGWRDFETSVPAEMEAARGLRDAYHARAEANMAPEKRVKLTTEARRIRNLPPLLLALDDRGKPSGLRKDVEEALAEAERKLYTELMKRLDQFETERREQQPQMWAFYSPASSPHAIGMLPPKGDYPLPFEPEKLKETQPVVLVRGEPSRPSTKVQPGWPEIFGAVPAEGLGARPRMALVKWLTHPNHPLTARVWVNYIWQQHFGRGLVDTPADFGLRGAKPSHPELLDWLSIELVRSGWSTKHIHRLIVASSTYRQGSARGPHEAHRAALAADSEAPAPGGGTDLTIAQAGFSAAVNGASGERLAAEEIDPENRLLWRFQPRRLEAEVIRDSALFVSGELDLSAGGPSVNTNRFDTEHRRTLYLRQVRGSFPRPQAMFDGPTANESCARRHVSTVPLQPLYLLNNPFWVARAGALAARVEILANGDRDETVRCAFELCFARPPTEPEQALALGFLAGEGQAKDPRRTLAHFCQALLNANEFAYVE